MIVITIPPFLHYYNSNSKLELREYIEAITSNSPNKTVTFHLVVVAVCCTNYCNSKEVREVVNSYADISTLQLIYLYLLPFRTVVVRSLWSSLLSSERHINT